MSTSTSVEIQRKRRRLNNEDEDRNRYGDVTVDGEGRVWQGNSHDTHYHFHDRSNANEEAKSTEQLSKELVQSLKFKNIDSRLQNVLPALAKTCQWLFRHKTFLAWNDEAQLEEHKGFLWIKGNPGVGKSTIMKTALQWAKRNRSKKYTTISYFFNAQASADLEKSPPGLYRSLVYQLLQASPALLPMFHDMFSSKNDSDIVDWTETELQGFLLEAIKCEGRSPLCIFIDALDEGNDKDIRALVSFLEDLSGHAVGCPSLRICLSSRHYPHITVRKGLSLTVEAQREHGQDIEMYVTEKLHASEHKQLRDELCRKSAGIFLWVVLVVRILNQMYDQAESVTEMTRYLQSVPKDLEGVFVEILKRDPNGYQQCVSLLQWISYSMRPLSSIELYLAVQHSYVHSNQEEFSLPTDDALTRYLVHNSHGLVELTRSEPPVAQFIHETVREFLVGKNGLCRLDPTLQENPYGWSHARLAQACLCYFSQQIHNLPPALNAPDANYAGLSTPQVLSGIPFMEYAVNCVFSHAELAEQNDIPQRALLNLLTTDRKRINCQWRHVRNLLEKYKVRRYGSDVTVLYIMVDMNLSNLAQTLANDHELVNVKCGRYGSALKCACRGGNVDIVRDLLQKGAHTRVRGGEFKTPLHAAVAAKNLEVLQMLLSFQNWNSETLSGVLFGCFQLDWTPGIRILSAIEAAVMSPEVFHIAVERSLADVVRSYLVQGGDVDAVYPSLSTWSKTALHVACEQGLTVIVELLLTFGADIHRETSIHRLTALHKAAVAGNVDTVQLLLEHGASVGANNSSGRTPLHTAVNVKDVKIVNLLLQHGADANKPDFSGHTPLHLAILYGYDRNDRHTEIVKVLLRNSVDVDKKDRLDKLLHIATKNGRVKVIKALLDCGANIRATDHLGNTVLHIAVKARLKETVSLLVHQGADVNARNNDMRTALHLAVTSGIFSIFEFLLKSGFLINQTTNSGNTLLHYVAGKGLVGHIGSLIESGADIEQKNEYDQTPLHFATCCNEESTVVFLLHKGADVNAKDINANTALHRAAQLGYHKMVEILLHYKADASIRNDFGHYAMYCAAAEGNLSIVKLLQRLDSVQSLLNTNSASCECRSSAMPLLTEVFR